MLAKRRLTYALSSLAFLIGAASAAHAQSTPPQLSVLPALPTTVEPIHVTVAMYCAVFHAPVVQGNIITIDLDFPPCPHPLPDSPPNVATFAVGPLAARTYTVQLGVGADKVASQEVVVREPVTHALLGRNDTRFDVTRFDVTLRWHDARVGSGDGFAQQLTTDSAYFWFFHPSNMEVTIKVLDGRWVNGHYWIFIASMTDVGFDLTVTERMPQCGPVSAPCRTRVYSHSSSSNRNFIDVEAF